MELLSISSIYPSIYPSMSTSIHPSIYLSIYRSFYLYTITEKCAVVKSDYGWDML